MDTIWIHLWKKYLYKQSWKYQDVSGHIRKYQEASGSIRKYQEVSGSIRKMNQNGVDVFKVKLCKNPSDSMDKLPNTVELVPCHT